VILTNLTGKSITLIETERQVGASASQLTMSNYMSIEISPGEVLIVSDTNFNADDRLRAAVNYLLAIGSVSIDQVPAGYIQHSTGVLLPEPAPV
jgi:hypothetical protein